jgi:alkyldihydroxyacetonephosphate synthase
MGEQVLGMEAVMPDGEVIRTKGVPKPASGPDLNHLLIGSEGTFGIVTEATLRAFPRAERRTPVSFDFPGFEYGFSAVVDMQREGLRPTMIDYGEDIWEDGEAKEPATVYLVFDGFAKDVETQVEHAASVCARHSGTPGDPAEMEHFWKFRHDSADNYRKNVLDSPSPNEARKRRSAYRMDYLHVALPVSQVLDYRRRCQLILEGYAVRVREWSLWARPEFFSFLIGEAEDAAASDSSNMGELVDRVLTLAQDMGGTMEYCHGVGLKLSHLVERESGGNLAVIRKLKAAIDPGNILNPGKLTG